METKVAVCKKEEQKEIHILNLMENAQTGYQLDGFLVDRKLITIKQQQKTVETRFTCGIGAYAARSGRNGFCHNPLLMAHLYSGAASGIS